MFISQVGRDFKNSVYAACFEQLRGIDIQPYLKLPVSYALVWYRPRKAGDLSNVIKALEDALEGIVFENDRQVYHFEPFRRDDKYNPRLEMVIAYDKQQRRLDLLQHLL